LGNGNLHASKLYLVFGKAGFEKHENKA